jgi:two-component system, OmpR family, phosphate regulon sensor histidine kinase PhoR
MKQASIKWIIILAAVAFGGLLVSQLFWARRAAIIARDQFDHRANLALKDVIDELQRRQNMYGISFNGKMVVQPDSGTRINIFQRVDTLVLRQLMEKYVSYHQLDPKYVYEIRKSSNDSVVYRSETTLKYTKAVPHKACLSCFCQQDPYHLALFFPGKWKFLLVELSLWLVLSFVFILIAGMVFSWVIFTIIRQKRLSEMKNDFINNMTHEFKTPISTISLAAEVLMNADPGSSIDRLQKYAHIIYDENQRMRGQVDRVLHMAQLEKGEYQLNKTNANIHELLQETIRNLCLEHGEKPVNIVYQLDAKNPVLNVDVMHVKNIISNLVNNAVKYSGEKPELHIQSWNDERGLLFALTDNGIGMNAETQKHIFDKFYRVPTGNIHNVKGFGLGLYYVRTMLEAHGGWISVKSEWNKGSRFEVFIPFV